MLVHPWCLSSGAITHFWPTGPSRSEWTKHYLNLKSTLVFLEDVFILPFCSHYIQMICTSNHPSTQNKIILDSDIWGIILHYWTITLVLTRVILTNTWVHILTVIDWIQLYFTLLFFFVAKTQDVWGWTEGIDVLVSCCDREYYCLMESQLGLVTHQFS